ncbi:PilZ domain-containing protein [bacterium]|nr:PilZ domain-containing protein [candidate division CSSED10-310 bacterium]
MSAGEASKQVHKQRQYPRKPIKTNVYYQYNNVRLNRIYAGSGHTVNLSMKGALIRIENYLPPRAEVELYITMKDGKEVSTLSQVIHCHRVAYNVYEVGVQFLRVGKSKQAAL